jgi:DNA-binding transcriptional LysR family regulator
VLPEAAVVEEVKAGRLKSYRLEDPEIHRTVAIVWPKNRVTADGLWAVTQIIRQRAADMVEQGAWPGATLINP